MLLPITSSLSDCWLIRCRLLQSPSLVTTRNGWLTLKLGQLSTVLDAFSKRLEMESLAELDQRTNQHPRLT